MASLDREMPAAQEYGKATDKQVAGVVVDLLALAHKVTEIKVETAATVLH